LHYKDKNVKTKLLLGVVGTGTGTVHLSTGTEVLYEYVDSIYLGTIRTVLITGTDIAAPIRFDFKLADFSAMKTFLPIPGMAAKVW
jgi:hypothetical protein